MFPMSDSDAVEAIGATVASCWIYGMLSRRSLVPPTLPPSTWTPFARDRSVSSRATHNVATEIKAYFFGAPLHPYAPCMHGRFSSVGRGYRAPTGSPGRHGRAADPEAPPRLLRPGFRRAMQDRREGPDGGDSGGVCPGHLDASGG